MTHSIPSRYGISNRPQASNVFRFRASEAKFENVTGESAAQIRARMRNGETIFVNYGRDATFYMWNSNGEIRFSSDFYKEQSVKSVVDRAKEMYSTPLDTSGNDLRTDRYNSRLDVVSRKGDSATNSSRKYQIDAKDWLTDASGYSYDANRLYKKLIELHDDDSAYIINKASKTFRECVNMFSDKIKKIADQQDTLDLDYFHEGSFASIMSKGSDILRDCATAANRIKEILKYRAESEEEYSSRTVHSNNYSEYRKYKSDELADEFDKMMSCKRNLSNLVKDL